MSGYQFYLPTKVINGPDSIEQLGEEIQRLSISKVILVTDDGIAKSGLNGRVEQILKTNQISYVLYSKIKGEAKTSHAEEVASWLTEANCDGVIGFGGGSSIDTAKGAALLATNGGRLFDYSGMRKFGRPPLPVIAIPTTAGTGSEVTDAAVFHDSERQLKFTVRHPEWNRPALALLDPILLQTLPASVAKISGIDALTHAIESYVSLQSNIMTETLSLQSIELIVKHIEAFIRNPANIEAANGMLIGSNLAGIAFSHAGTGNCHCLARFIGGKYEIAHGLLCGLTLPHVVEFNLPSQYSKYAKISRVFNPELAEESDEQAAFELPQQLIQLLESIDLPASLQLLGVQERDLPTIAKDCAGSWYNDYNPRYTSEEDFLHILNRCY